MPAFFPRGVQARRRRRLAPRGGDLAQGDLVGAPFGENDHAVAAPGPRAAARHVADRARGSAGERDFLEFSFGEKRERTRRPATRRARTRPPFRRSACGVAASKARTKICAPLKEAAAAGDVAQKAILRPSGDSAKNEAVTLETTTRPVSGGGTSKRMAPGEGWVRSARAKQQESGHGRRQRRGRNPRSLSAPRTLGRRRRRAGTAPADPFELASDVARALPAVLGILREALSDDPVERRRRHRLELRDRLRLVAQDRRNEGGARAPLEGARTRRHLVEDCAQREDVRPRVGLAALRAAPAPCTETCRESSPPPSRSPGSEAR